MASTPTLEMDSNRSTPESSESAVTTTPNRKRELEEVKEELKRCKTSSGSAAEEFNCPISNELPISPVTAEDGRIYERSEIEKLIRIQGTDLKSPITNEPMGPRLTDVVQVRNTIRILVESGAIEGDLAKNWKRRLEQRTMVEDTTKKAEGGDTEAMWKLGLWHCFGLCGLSKDRAQAYKWFKKGADKHCPKCMADAGRMLIEGWGVDQNVVHGAVLTVMAANAGSDVACFDMGMWYKNGLNGFPEDYSQAKHWLCKVVDGSATVKHLSEVFRDKAARILRELESTT